MKQGLLGTADLRQGDVLLSLGRGELSTAIRLLDGGDYSHAALFSGQGVIEATEPRVVEHPLEHSLELHSRVYVDVFRHRGPSELGERVVRSARSYVGRPYSYGDLFLAGMLIATSARLPPAQKQVEFLLRAAKLLEFLQLDRIAEQGLVTCVELVVRAHVAADAPLELLIEGQRHFEGRALALGVRDLLGRVRSKGELADTLEVDWLEMRALFRNKYQDLLGLEASPADALVSKGLFSPDAELVVPHATWAGVAWPANLVTPRDLSQSPSLVKIGRVYAATATRPTEAQGTAKPASFKPCK